MTASVQGNKSKHTRGENERYLIRTRQNNVQIIGKFCLRYSDERTTDIIKTRDVINTYHNVTFESLFSNAPIPSQRSSFENDDNDNNNNESLLYSAILQ